jgi:hypothetical protein
VGLNGGKIDLQNLPLGALLAHFSKDWDGNLDGFNAPNSWNSLMYMYRHLGMIEPQRWRMCVGIANCEHGGILFSSSPEDDYEAHSAKRCKCGKFKRDCDNYMEKCGECGTSRKFIVAFDFLAVVGQLSLLMKSRSFSYDMLHLWRSRSRWMDKDHNKFLDEIQEFWDGEKMKLYQAFWIPWKTWELLVLCQNENC